MPAISLLLSLLAAAGCGEAVDPDDDGTGGELCFNGVDDDRDEQADCADPKCDEVAACVPLPDGFAAGALVPADQPCPEGFEEGETVVNQGLDQGVCEGCDCTAGSAGCTATVWYYEDDASCAADTGQTGGIQAAVPAATACGEKPISTGFVFGARVDVQLANDCTTSGTAEPSAAGWERTMKFCRAETAATGCAAGEVCVRRQADPATQCALAEGAADCTGYGVAESDWYTGFDDARTCGACTCESTGGSCAGVGVVFGSDYTCESGPGNVTDGTRSCFGQLYAPKVQLSGSGSPSTTCSASAAFETEAVGTGQQTLCCAPE